jgi:hypothetical protein
VKKYLILARNIGMLCLATFGALIFASNFSSPASAFGSWSWPKKEPTAYKIEAKGADFRVYEWESDSVPGKFCVAAFANAGPVGLDCDQQPETSEKPVAKNSDW